MARSERERPERKYDTREVTHLTNKKAYKTRLRLFKGSNHFYQVRLENLVGTELFLVMMFSTHSGNQGTTTHVCTHIHISVCVFYMHINTK